MINSIKTEEHIKLQNAVIQNVALPGLKDYQNLYIKREDLIHPAISGNKWYKLKYNLVEAERQGFSTLLTFGGAYSNHIYAVAAAGNLFGFKTIGIIRGEEHLPLNPTLDFASNNGMELHYVRRSEYRRKSYPEFLEKLKSKFGDVYIIPEGGSNDLAVKGASEIIENINFDFDLITLPCGTGGTLAGIIAGLKGEKQALGFSVLKGGSFLINNVKEHLISAKSEVYDNWSIILDYHFGGYAKISKELIEFINEFEVINGIQLDPVYTGKMMFGLADMIKKKLLDSTKIILSIHTGGLQGVEGMEPQIQKLLAK